MEKNGQSDELLNEAISFIVEREEADDFICEQMLDSEARAWCSQNCQNLRDECVLKFLKLKIAEKKT